MLSSCASNLEKQRDDFVRLNGWESWDIDLVSSSSTGLKEFVSQRKSTLEPVLENRSSEGEWFLEHTDVLPRLVALVKDTPRLVVLAAGNDDDVEEDNDGEIWEGIATLCHQMEVAMEYTELCEQVIGHIDEEISQCMSMVFEIKEKRLESSFTGHISASQLDHVAKEVYPWLSRQDRSIKETFCQLSDTKIKPLTVSLGFIPERVAQFSCRCEPIFPTFSSLVNMNWTNLEQQWNNLQQEFALVNEELSTKKWSSILQLAIDQLSEDIDAALLTVLQRVCDEKNMFVEEVRALSTKRLSTNSSIFSECSETTEMSEHGAISPRLSFAPQFSVKRRLHMRVVSLDRFSPKPVIKRHSISENHVLREINSNKLNQQIENDMEAANKLQEEQNDYANTSSSDWSNTSSSSVIVSTPESDALEASEPVEPLRDVQLPPPNVHKKSSPLHDMSVIMESAESPTASPGEGTTLKDSKCSCIDAHTPSAAIFNKFRSLKATKSFIPITNSPNRLLHRYPQLGSKPSTPDSASIGSLSSCSDTSFGSSIGSTSTVKLGETPCLLPTGSSSSGRQSLIPLPSPSRPSSRSSSRLGSYGTPLATPTRKPRLSYSGAGLSGMRSVSDTPVMTDASRRRSESSSSRRSSFLPSPVKRQSLLPPSTPRAVSREGHNSYHTGRVSREGIRGVSSRDGMSLANAGVRIVKPVVR